ncbi:hypothetical protein NVIRENTERO_03796 [Sodalis praecaptivus]|nr:hypothetical protein NVIRENTERO_03796 [Sodalis praecaptivus]
MNSNPRMQIANKTTVIANGPPPVSVAQAIPPGMAFFLRALLALASYAFGRGVGG